MIQDVDQATVRQAFGAFPSGVAAIAGQVDGRAEVLVVSSFVTGVSLDPPLVMFAVKNDSMTWPILAGANRLGVTVLAATHQGSVRQLASKDRAARFDGVPILQLDSGAIVLEPAPVWFETVVEQTHVAGDHTIVVLRIIGLGLDTDHSPLVWHGSGFHNVLGVRKPDDSAAVDEGLWKLLSEQEWW